jgi:hypothetical protein
MGFALRVHVPATPNQAIFVESTSGVGPSDLQFQWRVASDPETNLCTFQNVYGNGSVAAPDPHAVSSVLNTCSGMSIPDFDFRGRNPAHRR